MKEGESRGRTLLQELDDAVGMLRSRSPLRPEIAVVLGSGLGGFASLVESAEAVPFGDIPGFPEATVPGHRGDLLIGRVGGTEVVVLSGRVHLYEGYSPAKVVFPIRVLGRMGVKVAILTNAAGGIDPGCRVGDLMLVEDHLNLTGANPCSGPEAEALGPRFFDMSGAYDARLLALAERVCAAESVTARRGVYAAFQGPSYETPSEIKMARTLGADAVGMSTVPEVIAARQLGMRVLCLSSITNLAAGIGQPGLDHRDVLSEGARAKDRLVLVLPKILSGALLE